MDSPQSPRPEPGRNSKEPSLAERPPARRGEGRKKSTVTAAARAALISAWILAVGLIAVGLEVENVRAGVRIRNLMMERDSRVEKFRRLEMRFNRMASPDLLERRLPEDFRSAGARDPSAEAKSSKPRV